MTNSIVYTASTYSKPITTAQYSDSDVSNVYFNGNTIEVTTTDRHSSSSPLSYTKKISRDCYIDIRTGEVKEYTKYSEKSYQSQRKTYAKLKRLINANFYSGIDAIHVVLTYKDKMGDPFKLSGDFSVFIKKVKRSYPDIAYVWVAEPHKSGSWHLHVLIKRIDNKEIFIPVGELLEWWTHGNVHVNRVPQSNDFGGYFAYKYYDRLRPVYPSDLRVYSYSKKGICVPKPVKMTRAELNKVLEKNNYSQSSVKTIGVFREYSYTGDKAFLLNRITYEMYERNLSSADNE